MTRSQGVTPSRDGNALLWPSPVPQHLPLLESVGSLDPGGSSQGQWRREGTAHAPPCPTLTVVWTTSSPHKGEPGEKLQNPSLSPHQRWKAVKKTPNPSPRSLLANINILLQPSLCRPHVTAGCASHLAQVTSLGLLAAWPGGQRRGHGRGGCLLPYKDSG